MYTEFAQRLISPPSGEDLSAPDGLCTWNGSDPNVRYSVYRNNVVVSLISALEEAFPVVCQVVGVDFFRAMARVYVDQHQPESPIMAYYGWSFADFLDDFPPAINPLPYLADLARWEYAYIESFHSADWPEGDSPQGLVDIGQSIVNQPERLMALRVRLAPSVRLLSSPFAVGTIWLAHQKESPTMTGININTDETGMWVRSEEDGRVGLVRLPAEWGSCVAALVDGAPIGEAMSHLKPEEGAKLWHILLANHAVFSLD